MATMNTAVFSSLSSQSQKDAENKVEANAKNKYFEQKDNLCPIKLQWSFGINPEAPVISLTTENRTLLAYACSHVTMIYDYNSRKMLPLQGHRNPVKTLSTTQDGKWLLTADFGDDCIVTVWDIDKRTPVCTLFHPHGSEGMTAACISPDSKYIVTVGNEKCQNVYFWLWTDEKETPDASVSLIDTTSERVKEIAFNDEHPEQFALTTDYHVLFLTWNKNERALSYDYPKVMAKVRCVGIFNGSCYAPKMQQVFTATTNGYILVWTNVSSEDERKKHIKTVNLQNCSITVIIINKDMLVTGSSNGRITFYDYQLRLLYWCQSCDLDSIRWISFILCPNSLAPMSADISEKLEYDCQNDGKTKVAVSSKLDINVKYIPRNCRCNKLTDKLIKEATRYSPIDATLQGLPFNTANFFACSFTGVIALIEISKRKCNLVLRHPTAAITSIDAHPESNYIIVGDAQGSIYLYNYEEPILIVSRSMPPLPNFQPILERQAINENIVYVTCPHSHESLKAVTALKFSPRCDMLACGLENGAIWILHHITLEVLDEIPYKHSSAAVNKIAFTRCAEYMAYADNALTVVVFKRNGLTCSTERNVWNLLGKYHSHYLPVRDILFGTAASDCEAPRFFSLGEDQELVEYDLLHSGPYPVPGLKILRVNRIEQSAVPLCLAWYPQSGTERFLVTANSEYKYKIFSDAMAIRGTYLGPLFGEPVQQFQILTNKSVDYMIFATDREIGFQLLPLDGNPYKIVSTMGHPEKITSISVSNNGQTVFTIGYNDPCVLMWKIKYRSVDTMAQLSGEGLSPFYCLIEGGENGWLINEMKDLFYYVQILHQGENTTAARIISDTIVIEQISNLMRAIGYYPTNEEIDNMMAEVCYKHYVETGRLVDEITFEEFVRLYVNHRPAFGVCMRQMKEAFCAFVKDSFTSLENPILTREQFMDVLFGETISGALCVKEDHKLLGEPLTLQEAYMYLKLLIPSDEKTVDDHRPSPPQRSVPFDFRFLPTRISYKDFTMDIMGIELPGETRADN